MKKFFFIFVSIFLISCATSRFDSAFSPVYLTNSSQYALLPTEAMDGNLDGIQRMCADFGGTVFDFTVYAISDSTQLSMTILNEFGTTMGNLFYDGSNLDFDSAVFPKNLKAEYIVADFQLCFYKVDELKTALSKIGLEFENLLECGADGTCVDTRILRQKNKMISKITKTYAASDENSSEKTESLKSIRYENFLRGYGYTLTSEED